MMTEVLLMVTILLVIGQQSLSLLFNRRFHHYSHPNSSLLLSILPSHDNLIPIRHYVPDLFFDSAFNKRLIDDFFDSDDFFDRTSGLSDNFNRMPSFDIKENDKSFSIELDIPGVDKKDIKISIRDRRLFISAERKRFQEEKTETSKSEERYSGYISKSFSLPINADENQIDAKYKNGVLSISIGKVADVDKKTKVIEVK